LMDRSTSYHNYRFYLDAVINHLIIILFVMSAASKLFRAGRVFIWEGKSQPSCLKLPELITKTSVGPEHIVAIGESGYHKH
jgi:hypothetical protein